VSSLASALAAFGVAAAVFAVVAAAVGSGVLETTELHGYDFLLATRKQPSWPQEVAVIDFDDRTIDAVGVFPIPRRILAQVLERVASGEPAIIGLDILLDQKRDAADDQRLAEGFGS
jgi:CHASE2 domain-containing sensor protein